MLTPRQHELLFFIHERLKESGVSPSFDEIKDALHLKSKSGVHRLITALEERGFLQRLPNRARALQILKLPESLLPKSSAPNPHMQNLAPQRAPMPPANDDSVSLGIMGRIAAGTPIEALQDEVGRISVPADMLRNGRHYALEVDGDSMIDAGILNGDTAIIQHRDSADSGEIVVALVAGHEATLKRLRRKGDMIALEAANQHYETRIFPAEQVRVQGRLVGIMRRY